jgi:glycerophosphoryl diester phosphodiesterase
MRPCFLFVVIALFAACGKEVPVVNDPTWDHYESADAQPLPAGARAGMSGVYRVVQGNDLLGDRVALAWSWTASGTDTTWHVSIFTGKDAGLVVGQGRSLDQDLLLNCSWRQVTGAASGFVRLTVPADRGGNLLLGQAPLPAADSIVITGLYGFGTDLPAEPVELRWLNGLTTLPFERLAHRGGGRTAEDLGVSENSVEIIRRAARMGATGVEIDVRFTADAVPILYHDNTLNLRLIQPCGLVGPVEDYAYAQLQGVVRLVNGERIPTLEQALHTIVHETPLRVVWLDTKYVGSLEPVRALQVQYMQEAQALGRDVRILIGIPGQDQLDMLMALPDPQNVPSLCELDIDQVRAANSEAWGPRWTQGTQIENVSTMQAEGRVVYAWTVDVDDYIRQFVQTSGMNGVLTNYPGLVTYHHHVR